MGRVDFSRLQSIDQHAERNTWSSKVSLFSVFTVSLFKRSMTIEVTPSSDTVQPIVQALPLQLTKTT